MSAKVRRVALIVLVIGVLAVQYMARHPPRSGAAPVLGALPGRSATPDNLQLGRLTLGACTIGNLVADGVPTANAYCTDFEVPEDWNAAGGRQISLKVAIVKSDAEKADPDLVTVLDGGPGGAAIDDYPGIAPALQPLRSRRHILLIDQRGTGGSNPLSCAATEPAHAAQVPPPAYDPATAVLQINACLSQLKDRAAPQFYTTTDAVRDLEAVRQALGSPQLDLIGASYGTRVAQQYAGRYPRSVRSVVLDSPVPNRLVLLSEHARNLENALQALFARCRAEAACAKTFGDPYATLYRLRAALRAHAQTVDLRDPVSFKPLRLTLTAEDLAVVVRLYAYNPLTAALLPLMLQQADQGNYAPLLGQKKLIGDDLNDHINHGVELSVICAEDADLLSARSEDEATLMGNRSIEWTKALCRAWPHGTRPGNFHEPLVSAIPVLVLAGEFDPVTPPRYGTEIIKTLSTSRLLTVPGQGHGVLSAGCMPKLVDRFIDALQPSKLDDLCLRRLGGAPAFVDYNGAAP